MAITAPLRSPLPPERAAGRHTISSARGVLIVMLVINLLNYMDRWMLPAVAPKIKAEFGIGNEALGALGAAFTLVYGLTALPFGVWADRGVRKNVVAVGVGIWSVAILLSGAVTSAAPLFAARAAVGIGEAGYNSAGSSLLADYFPARRRAWVLSAWNSGATLGAAAGFIVGGLLADSVGWRWAFYATVAPGLLCTALAFRIREPVRSILAVPTIRITIVAQTLCVFALGGAAFWFPTLLTRRFHISVHEADLLSGGVLVMAGVAGTLGGGWLADRLLPRWASARLLVPCFGFACSLSAAGAGALGAYPDVMRADLLSRRPLPERVQRPDDRVGSGRCAAGVAGGHPGGGADGSPRAGRRLLARDHRAALRCAWRRPA